MTTGIPGERRTVRAILPWGTALLAKKGRENLVPVLLLALIACSLVFPQLGARCLWEDEADTAVIASNILISGLPMASDGRNFVSLFADHRDIRDGLYIWQPWLPNYLAAGSIALFGKTAFGARLPFALLFVILVITSYSFFKEIAGDRPQLVFMAVLIIVTSIPLLLHARQCRYYILAPLFSTLMVRHYLRFQREPSFRQVILLAAWFTALFNSFAPGAAILSVTLAADFLLRKPDMSRIRPALAAAALCLVVNLPLFFYARMWDRQFGLQPGHSGTDVFALYLLRYLLTINNHLFPIIIFVAAAIAIMPTSATGSTLTRDCSPESRLFALICVVQLLGFSLLSDYPFTRYLLALVPFVAFLGATALSALSGKRKWLSWVLVSLVLSSNVLSILPLAPFRTSSLATARWSAAGIDSAFLDPDNVGLSIARGEVSMLLRAAAAIPIAEYVRGLFDPPEGPVDVIVSYLKRNAAPNDTVKISYEATSLMYHTDLSVTSTALVGPGAPEWIIRRHFNPTLLVDESFRVATNRHSYIVLELPVADVQWNNQPDPLYHFYRTPGTESAPYVKILRRVSG